MGCCYSNIRNVPPPPSKHPVSPYPQLVPGRGWRGGGALPQRASVVSEKTERQILIENPKTMPNKAHKDEFMTLLNL